MTLHLAADIERIAVDFLVDQTDVAAIIDERAYTELPETPRWPLIRLTRAGGARTYPAWIDHPRLQVEAFADTKAEAHDLAATASAALLQQFPGVHDNAVVTSVDEDGGLIWLPDPSGGPGVPGRPRYLFTVSVTVHPVS
jgi:hypothetical protein